MHSEARLGAILLGFVVLWNVCGAVLVETGVLQPDTTIILMLILNALSSTNGISLSSSSSSLTSRRFFVDYFDDEKSSIAFLEAPLRVYNIMDHVLLAFEAIAVVLLCLSLFLLHRRPPHHHDPYQARRLMLVAWLITVLGSSLHWLVPYSQLVPFPTCSPSPQDPTSCPSPTDLATLFAVQRQIVGFLFALLATVKALPAVVVLIPVWVRVSKLLVAQHNDIGQMLYYSAFVLFSSLATIASFAGVTQAVGLWSFSASILMIWLFSSVHLTPLSSYKAWFHFVGSFYLSILIMVIWFALITPLGCNLLSLFFTGGGGIGLPQPAWRMAYRIFSLIVGLMQFIAHVFLTNVGIWHFFEWCQKVLARDKEKRLLSNESESNASVDI